MKKKILTLLFVFVMIFTVSFSVSAASPVLSYESAYDADKGVVTVDIYIDGALGLQAADLRLAYDPAMYEFDSYESADIADGMIIVGTAEDIEALGTCSVIFMEECVESDLDENGKLYLATFIFKPLTEDFDADDFWYWAQSYTADDADLENAIEPFGGNSKLMEDKTDGVTETPKATTTAGSTTAKGTDSVSGDIGSNWYVYLIAGALAVAAIAGIAFVVIKGNHNGEEEDASEDGDSEKTEDKE